MIEQEANITIQNQTLSFQSKFTRNEVTVMILMVLVFLINSLVLIKLYNSNSLQGHHHNGKPVKLHSHPVSHCTL